MSTETTRRPLAIIYAILTGLVSLGLQFVFNRLIFFYVVNTDYATVTVISLHLTGFLVGATLAGRLPRITLTHAFAAFPVLILASYIATWRYGLDILSIIPLLLALAASAFIVAMVSGFIIGRLINEKHDDRHAARIIVADTFGSVIGAVLAGFYMLPQLGIAATFLCFAVLSLPAAVMVRRVLVIPALALLALCWFYAQTPPQPAREDAKFRVEGFPLPNNTRGDTALVSSIISPFGVLSVVDVDRGMRLLHVDNMPLCAMKKDGSDKTTWSEWEIGAWTAKLTAQKRPAPKIAIVGLGCGLTLAGALSELPDDARVTMIEINPRMPEMTKQFTGITGDVLADPRVNLVIADGYKYFMERGSGEERFDAIIIDITWMRDASLTHMFTADYFLTVSHHMIPEGLFALWNDASAIDSPITTTIFATVQAAFPNVVVRDVRGTFLYFGSRDDGLIDAPSEDDKELSRMIRMFAAGMPINTMDNLVLNRHIFGTQGRGYTLLRYLDQSLKPSKPPQ